MQSKTIIITIFAALVICTNCNTPDPEPESMEYISIIKLPVEYQDGLILMPQIMSAKREMGSPVICFEYGDSLVFSNINETWLEDTYHKYLINDLNILNCQWYIRINDDYVIPTWRWREFMPLTAHFVSIFDTTDQGFLRDSDNQIYELFFNPIVYWELENDEYYYVNVSNSDIKDLTQKWILSEAEKINRPTIRAIQIRDLDKYRKQKMKKDEYRFYTSNPYFIDEFPTHSAYNMSIKDKEKETKYIAMRDSMDLIYAETIKTMICNNDLN